MLTDRIAFFRREGYRGILIAQIFHEDGEDLDEVRNAFSLEGYVVQADGHILFVSDQPTSEKIKAKDLPSIHWGLKRRVNPSY